MQNICDFDSLVQCRTDELYQEMIAAYGSRADGSDAVVLTTLDYWQWKAGDYLRQVRYYSLSARDLKTEKAYLDMLDGLMEKYADRPIVVEAYIRKADGCVVHPRQLFQGIDIDIMAMRGLMSVKYPIIQAVRLWP